MNLTITDDELLQRARIRALKRGTSVNAVLRRFLESSAGSEIETEARKSLAELARSANDSTEPIRRIRRSRLEFSGAAADSS